MFQMSSVEQSCSVELHGTRLLCYGRTFHFHLFPLFLGVRLYYGPRNEHLKCGFGREDHFHIVFPFKRTCPLSNHQTERSLAEEWKLAEDVCLTMEMFPGICSIPRSQPPFFLILNGSSFWMMRNLTIRTWWFLSTNP